MERARQITNENKTFFRTKFQNYVESGKML